jgi:hypothetical protein
LTSATVVPLPAAMRFLARRVQDRGIGAFPFSSSIWIDRFRERKLLFACVHITKLCLRNRQGTDHRPSPPIFAMLSICSR